MSDLSRLLDDVYGDAGTASATPPVTPPPDDTDLAGWGDDDTFAAWADDHGARLDGDDETTAPVATVPALGAASGSSLLSELGALPTEATAVVPVVAAPGWHRADDDILPAGRVRGGRRRRRGPAPAGPAAAPSIEAFAADAAALDALAALEVPAPAEGDPLDGPAATTPARRRGLRRRAG